MEHRLESVKLIQEDGGNQGDEKLPCLSLWRGGQSAGNIGAEWSRIFSSAVTASDYRDRGRPSHGRLPSIGLLRILMVPDSLHVCLSCRAQSR